MTYCVIEHGMEKKNISCTHARLEWLGADSDTLFARCDDCKAVVVTQNGFTFAVPAAQPKVAEQRAKAA